ncbi:efflux RND transporter periplasmic adaptor subunit [Gottfriedia sp. NPDC057991]|uniref:efflux RND transporter periplasmic adaptor subunit n=1 Tax=Gottfriedia sp. NPDC057991 TaxID=3346298 RepID=UPI0036DCE343
MKKTEFFNEEKNKSDRTLGKKKLILISALILVLISATVSVVYVEVRKSKSKTLEFISPTVKSFHKTKTILGHVVPGHSETIYLNPAKGSVKEIYIKAGETVTKGQNLFSYDDPTVEAEIGQVEVNKKLAETSVAQWNEQILSIEQKVQEATSATITNETTNQALQVELNAAKKELNAAELNVEKFSLEDEKLLAQKESLTIRSNTDGVVIDINQDIGQGFQAPSKQPILIIQIATKEPLQIEGTLTEQEKAKISLGQHITVTSKVVPNKKWKGEITGVSDYPTYKTSTNKDKFIKETAPYYTFKASLDTQEWLYSGFDTTLEVVVDSKDMLSVPDTSIMEAGKSKFVYVLKKGKIHKQKVVTGQKKGKWVAILKGLKEKDKIVVKPNWTVREGTKIDLK